MKKLENGVSLKRKNKMSVVPLRSTLISITTLIERDRPEARFVTYDDSDSESENIIYLLCDVSQS